MILGLGDQYNGSFYLTSVRYAFRTRLRISQSTPEGLRRKFLVFLGLFPKSGQILTYPRPLPFSGQKPSKIWAPSGHRFLAKRKRHLVALPGVLSVVA